MIYEGSICAQSGTVKIDMTRISLAKNLNKCGHLQMQTHGFGVFQCLEKEMSEYLTRGFHPRVLSLSRRSWVLLCRHH